MAEKNTRLILIETAEKIVAERGFSALSMREIQLQAGQWNKNVVQYYFGSIPGLISAIVDIRMAPIDAHRKTILAEMDQNNNDPSELFSAMIVPFTAVMMKNPKGYYARFLLQTFCDPNLSSIMLDNFYSGSFREVYNRLLNYAGVDPEIAKKRLRSIIGMILFSYSRWEASEEPAHNLLELSQDLIDMSAASFTVQRLEA